MISGELPSGWADALPSPTPEDKGKATRLHSQDCLNALASVIPGESVCLHADACPSFRLGLFLPLDCIPSFQLSIKESGSF